MALSILPLGPDRKQFGLWDSETNSYIEVGEESSMEFRKHAIESSEQAEDNERWAREVRQKRIHELVSAGHKRMDAFIIVKQNIPGLWQENS